MEIEQLESLSMRQRQQLAIECAEHVLTLYERLYTTDSMPRLALLLATAVLSHETAPKALALLLSLASVSVGLIAQNCALTAGSLLAAGDDTLRGAAVAAVQSTALATYCVSAGAEDSNSPWAAIKMAEMAGSLAKHRETEWQAGRLAEYLRDAAGPRSTIYADEERTP